MINPNNRTMVNMSYKATIETNNWVMEKAQAMTYPNLPYLSKNYRVFGAAPLMANATAFYRSMMPAVVLRNYYKVLDYVSGFELPSNIESWAPYLNNSEVLILEREFKIELLKGIKRYKERNGPILYDVDDHVSQFKSIGKYHTKAEKGINEFWDREEINNEVYELISNCQAIITTTQPLADFYQKATGIKSYCIKNSIDSVTNRWNFEYDKKENRDYIVFGFMGGATHGADTDLLESVVLAVLNECPNVKFKFIGYAPHWVFDIIFEHNMRDRIMTDFGFTQLDKYTQKMYNIDVGLVPLANNEFNRIGKSDLKYLEYTMAGAATVASKIGQYKECIRHKYNGLLVETPEDWAKTLISLARNPDRITSLHKNAVEDVLTNRSVLTASKDWYNTIITERKKWETSPKLTSAKEI